MEAADIIEAVGPIAVDTLESSLPVPLGQGRWRVLWLQYASWEDGEGERCRVFDACLIDAAGEHLRAGVGADVLLPKGDGPAALVNEALPDYLGWVARVATDGTAGMDEALARSGTEQLRPLYEAALAACERAAGERG